MQVEAISEFAVLASLIAGAIIATQLICHKHRRAGGTFVQFKTAGTILAGDEARL